MTTVDSIKMKTLLLCIGYPNIMYSCSMGETSPTTSEQHLNKLANFDVNKTFRLQQLLRLQQNFQKPRLPLKYARNVMYLHDHVLVEIWLGEHIIIPGKNKIMDLVVEWKYRKIKQMQKSMTKSELSSQCAQLWIWLLNGNTPSDLHNEIRESSRACQMNT